MRSRILPPFVVAVSVLVAAVLAGPTARAQVAAFGCSNPDLAFGGKFGTPVTAADSIVIGDAVTIGDLRVSVEIAHDWIAEVHLELTSPAGTKRKLQTGTGGNPSGLDLIYADGGVSHGAQPFDFGCFMRAAGGGLGTFAGESSQGSWTLTVTDDTPGHNDGVLESWCIGFFTAPQGTLPVPVLDLSCLPTVGGAALTWTNGEAYAGVDVLVDGVVAATLPGSASSHALTGLAGGQEVAVAVRPTTVGGVEACQVERSVIPLPPLPEPRCEKVVFVMIDGLRYSEGLGDANATYVPRMKALAAEGTIVEPFSNDKWTVTVRGVPALVCGSWDPPVTFFETGAGCDELNLYSSRPTFHESFRRQRNRPASDVPYIIGANSCPWRSSFHPSYGPSVWPQWVATAGKDDDVFQTAKALASSHAPALMTVYLHDVDGAGHSGSWNQYVAAIVKADQIVGDLWDHLQSLPAYAGKTTMIVTSDHGRHDYDFVGHGDGCVGCRTIQLLAVGPPIRKGHVSTLPRTIPDVTPTIGALLGFHTEYADGAVMDELFVHCQADLGLAGPGSVALRVCGGTLDAGSTAELSIDGGPAGAAALLVVSLATNPTPFLGGTLGAFPVAATVPMTLDAAGERHVPFAGGFGPLSITAQAAVADPGQAFGAALSNAVRIDVGP